MIQKKKIIKILKLLILSLNKIPNQMTSQSISNSYSCLILMTKKQKASKFLKNSDKKAYLTNHLQTQIQIPLNLQ